MPPQLDLEKSNIVNSENTALFLFSCFQYILTSVILSAGPPFRKAMIHNGMHPIIYDLFNRELTRIPSTISMHDHCRHSHCSLHVVQSFGMGVRSDATDIHV